MSVLEALAMGKPVVCTPVGALKEVVRDGENGYLVTPGDWRSLVTKIDALLGDKEKRDKMAENNYIYARKHFDVEVIASQIGEHIEAVMDGKAERS